ncbi:uncharacterized protein LODBEIA_P52580 [Lodderomyces beijingensis]|uniref:SIS domain-containing protein n=1 Tax=Lodderomyces beijingensis TaxID=1775926 RepID=A0ABP0ZSF8_9ASCO
MSRVSEAPIFQFSTGNDSLLKFKTSPYYHLDNNNKGSNNDNDDAEPSSTGNNQESRDASVSSSFCPTLSTSLAQSALASIKNTLKLENEAVTHLRQQYQIDEFSISNLMHSLSIMLKSYQNGGKIVICGIGKSYKLALKLVATLTSLCIPSCNLHPSEALHGDLGMINEGVDCLIMLTSSGNTPELINLLPHLSPDLPIILLTCSRVSKLSTSDQVKSLILAELAHTHNEESIHGLPAPTVSTTLSLILADSVILALSELIEANLVKRRRQFGLKHPGGSIGASLNLQTTNQHVGGGGASTASRSQNNAPSPTPSSLPSEVGSTTSLLSLKNNLHGGQNGATPQDISNERSASTDSENDGLEFNVPHRVADAQNHSTSNVKTVSHEQVLNLTEFDILQWITLYDYLQIQNSNLKLHLPLVKKLYKDFYENKQGLEACAKNTSSEANTTERHWNKFKWELLRSFS